MGLQIVSEKQKEASRDFCKKNFSKRVLQYDLNNNFIKEWESMQEVQRQLKIKNGSISKCCNGKAKTAGGFIWRIK